VPDTAAATCISITDATGAEIGTMIPGPTHIYRREPAGDHWCFGCRKRLPHEDVLIGDPPGVETYYDHVWQRRCSGCGRDRTRFPGTEWW
jgi:hypothetical protein